MADKKKICIMVTPTEYELIAANARSVDRTLSAYVREVALNRIVIHNNYDAILENTREVRKVRSNIYSLIKMLVDTRKFYPADLKYLESLVKEIGELQRKMLRRTEQDRNYYRKYINELLNH